MGKRKKNKEKAGLGIVFKCCALVFIVYACSSTIQLQLQVIESRRQLEEIKRQYEEQRITNGELLHMIETDDLAEIAREQYGLVYPDERIFYDSARN